MQAKSAMPSVLACTGVTIGTPDTYRTWYQVPVPGTYRVGSHRTRWFAQAPRRLQRLSPLSFMLTLVE